MKKTILFGILMIIMTTAAMAFVDTFDTCNNWLFYGATPATCSGGALVYGGNANKYLGATAFSPTDFGSVESSLYTKYDAYTGTVDAFTTDSICEDDQQSNCVGVYLSKTNGIEIIDDAVGTLNGCAYTFLPSTTYSIKSVYFDDGSVAVYINDNLECSASGATTISGGLITFANIWVQVDSDATMDNFYSGYTDYVACTPSWSCSEYSDCKINPMSHRDCLSVSDANNCGEPFTGDLADYTIQGCPTESKTSKIAYFNNVNQQKAAEQPAGIFAWINNFIMNLRSMFGLQ